MISLKDPYPDSKSTEKVRIQAYVPQEVKDAISLVIPDRHIHTILLNHAIKRTVEFIRANNLKYDTADQQRLTFFIEHGYDNYPTTTDNIVREYPTLRPSGNPVSRTTTRRTTKSRSTPQNTSDITPVV